jgi:hypothetical protein
MLLVIVNGFSKNLIMSIDALNKIVNKTKIDIQKRIITFVNKHIFNIDIEHNKMYIIDYYLSDNSYESRSKTNCIETYNNIPKIINDSDNNNPSHQAVVKVKYSRQRLFILHILCMERFKQLKLKFFQTELVKLTIFLLISVLLKNLIIHQV